MSLHENELFLENKLEMVQIACEEGDYLTAQAIVADTKEEGFDTKFLEEEILNTPLYNFSAFRAAQRSPYFQL